LPKKSKEKPQLERRALLAINEHGGAGKLRRVVIDRDWRNLLNISAPLPLIKTFGIRPLFAGSVSTDNTFKQRENEGLVFFLLLPTRLFKQKVAPKKWNKKIYSEMVCFFT
jgi:hypothetical protein